MGGPAAVPLALLALVVLQLLALPLQNVVTRHMEAEADWSRSRPRATRRPGGSCSRGSSPTTLERPGPAVWDYVLLENHPTIMQRIAMTRAWRATPTSAAQSP